MSFIVEFVGSVILSLLWWLLLFPVVWLVASPVILIAAPFAEVPYWQAVRGYFGCVTDVWARWGLVIVP
jgi:hypothetical protein